jgi:ABC-2 type transport system ATP-binding protein
MVQETSALLDIQGLTVRFGRLTAVADVSLTLRGGELLGLIGPNGAGKTTLLRAASGFQLPTRGTISVMGHDVFRDPTYVGRHLGFTPDTPALYEELTVDQFLDFIGRCYDLPANERSERIEYWLEAVWLGNKRQDLVRTLSRGMRQRLAVARTLLSDPHVILLDEPAAGLDPAGRVQFRRLLADLRDQGKAIIVSSHILADLAEYCTHIAIMEHGRFLKSGTVAAVSSGEATTRCRYRVVLAQRIGDARHRLQDLDGITQLELQGDVFTFEAERDRAHAAALLRQIIAAGLPVADFRALEVDLEQAYLRSGIQQVD